MKKIFSFTFLGFVLSLLAYNIVFALSDADFTKLIGDLASFGYGSGSELSVKEISNTTITFKSPVIQNDFGEDVSDYVLLFSNHSIDELVDDIALINSFTELEFSPAVSNGEITLSLNRSDNNLNQSTIYYVVVVPKDDYGDLGNKSNEICFRLSDQLTGAGNGCVGTTPTTTTYTPDSWKKALELANVSCTWDGKKVTVNWVLSDVGNAYISLYNERTSNFDRKGTVNLSNDRTFSFNVTQNTAPIVRFDDSLGLQAYKTYTCHTLATNDTPVKAPQKTGTTSTITKVPTVGPKENALAVIIGAVVLYLVYRMVRRKAD